MEVKEWFTTAAAGLRTVARGIDETHLDRPGLGDWDVRALLGHTCRAFSTIETYLDADPAADAVVLAGPADYFGAVTGAAADPDQVRQRGIAAGEALGATPAAAAVELADRITDLVARTAADARVATPFGVLDLRGYLPTRAFELTVHGMDLARATGQEAPPELVAAASPAIELCAEIAIADQRLDILSALTGRGTLPAGFSVV